VPADYDPDESMSLLIFLHGYSPLTTAWYDILLPLQEDANDRGYIFVKPDGSQDGLGEFYWNATEACCDMWGNDPDHVGYLLTLVDSIEANCNIDPQGASISWVIPMEEESSREINEHARQRVRYLLGYQMMPTIYTAASGAQGVPRPLLASRVEAGFPSPADDYVDRALDLNEEFIARPAATFFLRAGGCSMEGAGIYDGDLLIVDRSISPELNTVIVAVVDGEFTVKRLCKSSDGFVLAAEHPSYPPIAIEQDTGVCAWGVVTWVIHRP